MWKFVSIAIIVCWGGMVSRGMAQQGNAAFWKAAETRTAEMQPEQLIYRHDARLQSSLNPVKFALRSAMYFYQQKITYQLPGSCIYTPSCSEFSRQCFEMYGPVKAFFLSADRLARCNKFELSFRSQYDIISGDARVKFNDPASRYQFHHHE